MVGKHSNSQTEELENLNNTLEKCEVLHIDDWCGIYCCYIEKRVSRKFSKNFDSGDDDKELMEFISREYLNFCKLNIILGKRFK